MKIGRKLHSRMTLVLTFIFLFETVCPSTALLAETPQTLAETPVESVTQESGQQQLSIPMKFVVGEQSVPFAQLPAATGYVSLIHKGKVTGRYPIGPGGIVQVPKPLSGVYTIVTRSPSGISMASMYISDKPQLEEDWAARFALVPVSDYPAAEALIMRAFSTSQGSPALGQVVSYESQKKIPNNSDALQRDADGTVRVRMLSLSDEPWKARTISGLSVHFIQAGKIVAYNTTDENGYLYTSDLKPGRYSMVVSGSRNQLLTSVYVTDRPAGTLLKTAVSSIQDFVLGASVAAWNQPTDSTASGVVGEEDATTANTEAGIGQGGPDGFAGAPSGPGAGGPGGGGTGGGSGGGGGVGGGGGLLGALAAGLAGAALGIAASDDDDNVASPASPAPMPAP